MSASKQYTNNHHHPFLIKVYINSFRNEGCIQVNLITGFVHLYQKVAGKKVMLRVVLLLNASVSNNVTAFAEY